MKVQNTHQCIDDFPNFIIIMSLEKQDDNGKPYMLALHSERPFDSEKA
jgi:hypothetical protein